MSLSSMNAGPLGAAVGAALVSLGLGVLVLCTGRWHGRWTFDADRGVQKLHTAPTPRIGGLGVWLGVAWGLAIAPPPVQHLGWPCWIAASLAFAVGLWEDLTKRVSAGLRLAACLLSGLGVCALSGLALSRVDVWGVDLLLGWAPVSWVFTSIALAGVANSFNIIDGCHGLSSGTALLGLLGLCAMAAALGDGTLLALGWVLIGAVAGFFVLNWPWGKIFLGDGGAYFVGFSLAWMAVLLIERHPSVSAFAVLLVCAYPVTEVLFSMYRRSRKRRRTSHPDRLHLHSLLKRRYVRRWCRAHPPTQRNAVAGGLLWSLSLGAAFTAGLTRQSQGGSVLAVAIFVVVYVLVYGRMARHRWRWSCRA